jgi:transcriptional regulator with XRE-family HTH domain
MPSTTAARLRFARTSLGWTQIEAARKLGVDVQTLSRWERGDHFPAERYRHRIERIYRQSIFETVAESSISAVGSESRISAAILRGLAELTEAGATNMELSAARSLLESEELLNFVRVVTNETDVSEHVERIFVRLYEELRSPVVSPRQ